ncbi:hypothetical protein TD95_000864 [Thielaviopsis punctulata]|uniref:Diphthine--ammonia ligase n=1 Tax=Thielaviopsis punctulata TaxID=72032 RepID=A0A0F4ZA77_9PEZI|nr:hypothetical protein TD95_000864 [Thielaviopsis punctulata]
MSGLNVIALVSGGKDSFFAALHAQHNGHRLVALANLYPGPVSTEADAEAIGASVSNGVVIYDPKNGSAPSIVQCDDAGQEDPNSFMYQTVGHQVLPLYAQALDLPLYRRALGNSEAVQSIRDYETNRASESDETESMVPLLQEVMRRHPEANAVSAGAILSTYQRTRVESVAIRLGLTPLAYLWKFPLLPSPSTDDAQLLRDMEAAGMDARMIKVASAGLDDDFLWTKASSSQGVARIQKALKKFGGSEGAVLGEGGEFETLVVDGPSSLFKRRISVPDNGKKIVKEGGGTAYLEFGQAIVEDKSGEDQASSSSLRTPDLLEPQFAEVLKLVRDSSIQRIQMTENDICTFNIKRLPQATCMEWHWTFLPDVSTSGKGVKEQTKSCVLQIRDKVNLWSKNLPSANPASDVIHNTVMLRRMEDFGLVNKLYGEFFQFANPPARVTVSVGDSLPDGYDIAICVTSFPGSSVSARTGLHVQSRSYWAPANIGPYSQAIDHGVMVNLGDGGDILPIRVVSVAGQIPLIPATMQIPENEPDASLEIVLSLQHLWRISREMKTQIYTGMMAIFPKSESEELLLSKVNMAAKAWEAVHPAPKDEDAEEEASDVDVWDQKHNADYATYGDQEAKVALPDWEVYYDGTEFTGRRASPFFAVEVDTLPRNAACEWQAHAGLSRLEPMCLATGFSRGALDKWEYQVRYTRLREGSVRFIHGAVGISGPVEEGMDIRKIAQEAWCLSLNQECKVAKEDLFSMYIDVTQLGKGEFREGWACCMPCRSVWSAAGEKLLAVGWFRTGEIS